MLNSVLLLAVSGALVLVLLRAWPSRSWLAVRVATVTVVAMAGAIAALVVAIRSTSMPSAEQAGSLSTPESTSPSSPSSTSTPDSSSSTSPSTTGAEDPLPLVPTTTAEPSASASSTKPAPPPLTTSYLFDVGHLQETGFGNWNPKAAEINGALFPRSIVADDIGRLDTLGHTMTREYNLRRTCRKLVFTAGVTDESDSGTAARFEVYADGTRKFSRSASFGHSFVGAVDVTGTLRLKLSVTSTTHTALAAAFGDARVTCSQTLPSGG